MQEWRNKDPKYQLKTDGGVYFWSAPNAIWGRDIDEKMYKKLPAHMKKAVVALDNEKTMDGNHAIIYYIDNNGVVQYLDEYGLSDFYYQVKQIQKDETGTASDWNYNGKYKVGEQLQKNEDREIEKWVTINGKHVPIYKEGN